MIATIPVRPERRRHFLKLTINFGFCYCCEIYNWFFHKCVRLWGGHLVEKQHGSVFIKFILSLIISGQSATLRDKTNQWYHQHSLFYLAWPTDFINQLPPGRDSCAHWIVVSVAFKCGSWNEKNLFWCLDWDFTIWQAAFYLFIFFFWPCLTQYICPLPLLLSNPSLNFRVFFTEINQNCSETKAQFVIPNYSQYSHDKNNKTILRVNTCESADRLFQEVCVS